MHRRLLIRMHIAREQNGFPLLWQIGFLSEKEADLSQNVLLLFKRFLHKKLLWYSLPNHLRPKLFILKIKWVCFLLFFFSFPLSFQKLVIFSECCTWNASTQSWRTAICTSDKWWYFTYLRWAVWLSTALPFDSFPSNSPAHFPNKRGCCAASREVPFGCSWSLAQQVHPLWKCKIMRL